MKATSTSKIERNPLEEKRRNKANFVKNDRESTQSSDTSYILRSDPLAIHIYTTLDINATNIYPEVQ